MEGYITSYDVEPEDHNECGQWYRVRCPECKNDVRVTGTGWPRDTCECGRAWRISLIATGIREPKD